MLKDSGIRLGEEDRLNINYFIDVINTAAELMDRPKGIDDFTEDEAREYYLGCAQALVEGRVGLHHLKQDFSKKYNIPYNFISRDGEILLQDEEACASCASCNE